MIRPHELLLVVLVLIMTPSQTRAEIRPYEGIILPDPNFVHYTEAYIVEPGSLDLSKLVFQNWPGEFPAEYEESKLDVVVFPEPEGCPKNILGTCDWITLGVGATDRDGAQHWCCSAEIMTLGYCSEAGRLILNSDKFTKGVQRELRIPAGSDGFLASIEKPVLSPLRETGKYAVLFASCSDQGRPVVVSGTFAWHSKHGYLPGELYGEMYYFFFLTVFYAILAGWYGFEMKKYEETSIPIQKWILATILLGLVETLLRSLDYIAWNDRGTRIWFFWYVGVGCGVLKHALSRSLVVMVSMGWGVARNHLNSLYRIIVLGVMYATLALAGEILSVVAIADMQTLSLTQEEELIGAVAIISFFVMIINILYLVWILAAMVRTMEHLRSSNQNMKYLRYRRLREILLFFIAFAIIWLVLTRAELLYKFLETQREWIVAAMMELDYLAVITGVAILWKPGPNARDFAYEMQLPDTEENELELREEVPSALMQEDEDLGFAEIDADYKAPAVENGVAT